MWFHSPDSSHSLNLIDLSVLLVVKAPIHFEEQTAVPAGLDGVMLHYFSY
jgi:hypothetical protein